MATKRLSMRRTRKILRQKLELGRSHREVATSLELSVGAVSATVMRAAAAGLSWTSVQGLSDEAAPQSATHGRVLVGVDLLDQHGQGGARHRAARGGQEWISESDR
jgi:hypothetical protein